MNDFCPDCGTKFDEPRDLKAFWIRLLKCPSCKFGEFMEVADAQWIFPLQRLNLGIHQKLMEANSDLIAAAVKKICQVNYKTVSIVEFEQLLNGTGPVSET